MRLGIGLSLTAVATAIAAAFAFPVDLDFTQGTLPAGVAVARTSLGTIYGPDGALRNAPHNLLQQSVVNASAVWFFQPAGSVTAAAATAPDGSGNAALFTAAAGQISYIYQAATVIPLATYTFSVWVKLGTLAAADYKIAVYNETGGSFIAQEVVPAAAPNATGWTRVTYTFTTPAGCVSARVYGLRNGNSAVAGTLYFYGAQLELNPSASAYVATTTAAAYGPRLSYDAATLAPAGLLVEEARTNTIRNSTIQGAVVGAPGTLPTNWLFTAGTTGIACQVIATGIEAGVPYIDLRYTGTAASTSACSTRYDGSTNAAAASGQAWTLSAFCKLVAGSLNGIYAVGNQFIENNSAGSFLTGGAVNFAPTATLQRYAGTRTLTDASVAYVACGLSLGVTSGQTIDVTLRIGLPQLELGASATSPIPTYGSSAIRSADVVTMTPSFITPSAGTIAAEWSAPSYVAGTFPSLWYFDSGSASDTLTFGVRSTQADVRLATVVGGANNLLIDSPSNSITAGSITRAAGRYAAGDVAVSANGGTPATAATGSTPASLTRCWIGSSRGATNFLNGHIRRLRYSSALAANADLMRVSA